jgi:putative transposase
MSRQLRVEYAGAFYHVFSRGNQKQPIFLSDEDRLYFLKVLGDVHRKFEVIFQAYCLMPNHYHLNPATPYGGLSKAMHFLNTAYSVYLNRKHGRCGHLFQGRFKAILVEASSYALELSRYVHLNPVRAGFAVRPEDYAWSSYREYLGLRIPYPWLDPSRLVGRPAPGGDRKRRAAYAAYVLAGIGADPPAGYYESKRTGILGSEEFIDSIRRDYLKTQVEARDREKPQLGVYRKRVPLSEILDSAKSSIGPRNKLSRSAAIYLSHRCQDYPLMEIAIFHKMSISGVSNARRRAEKEIGQSAKFARMIDAIAERLQGRPGTGTDSPFIKN